MRRPKRSGRTLKASRCVDDRVTFGLDFFFLSLSFSFSRERERDERWSRRGTREARARARSATGECLRRRAFFVESARPESLSLLGTFFFSLLLLTLFSLSLERNETKRPGWRPSLHVRLRRVRPGNHGNHRRWHRSGNETSVDEHGRDFESRRFGLYQGCQDDGVPHGHGRFSENERHLQRVFQHPGPGEIDGCSCVVAERCIV
jgi:hypothetical protein